MSFISEIDEDCYEESDIENIFRQSAGGTIIIELRGSRGEHRNYANCYEKVIQDFSEKVCKYQRDTRRRNFSNVWRKNNIQTLRFA